MIAHYKNGREAKNGDRVLWSPSYRPARIAPLYDVEPDSRSGHAKFVTEDPLPLYVDLKECLHLDDALAAMRANAADPIVSLQVEPKASPPPTTPTGLHLSQQLDELRDADPDAMAKSLTSMRSTLAAQADAAVGDAAAGSHPIDTSKQLPGEVPTGGPRYRRLHDNRVEDIDVEYHDPYDASIAAGSSANHGRSGTYGTIDPADALANALKSKHLPGEVKDAK